jgi:hypothetical protein
MKKLSLAEFCLLQEVLSVQSPCCLPVDADLSGLQEHEISQIRQAITIEFCRTGLNPDYEPNERGIRLEDLLDKIGAK